MMILIMPRARAASVPGPDLQPESSPGGISGRPRIDDNQVLAVVQGLHVPVAHFGVGAADFQLLGPGNLGLGEFSAPAVIIAIQAGRSR